MVFGCFGYSLLFFFWNVSINSHSHEYICSNPLQIAWSKHGNNFKATLCQIAIVSDACQFVYLFWILYFFYLFGTSICLLTIRFRSSIHLFNLSPRLLEIHFVWFWHFQSRLCFLDLFLYAGFHCISHVHSLSLCVSHFISSVIYSVYIVVITSAYFTTSTSSLCLSLYLCFVAVSLLLMSYVFHTRYTQRTNSIARVMHESQTQ